MWILFIGSYDSQLRKSTPLFTCIYGMRPLLQLGLPVFAVAGLAVPYLGYHPFVRRHHYCRGDPDHRHCGTVL